MRNYNILRFVNIIIWNLFIFVFLVVLIESSFYFARKILNKTNIGWIYRSDQKISSILEEHPCVRMETHPIFSHVPDHQGECQILGGFSDGPFVRYSKNNFDAVVTLGGSTTSGFYQHYANGKTWPYLLNKIFLRENLKYQVINGGHGGYSTSEELMQLLLNVRRLKDNLKVIISFNGINDLYLQENGNYFLSGRVNEMYEKQIWINQSSIPRFLPNTYSFINFFSLKSSVKTNMGKREQNKLSNIKKLSPGDIWESNVKSMKAVANEMGAEYYTILQPTMGLEGIQSTMPENTLSNDGKMLKLLINDKGEFKEGYQAGYRKNLNKIYNDLLKRCKSMNFCIDLTNVAPPSGENYDNPRHHNENGNYLIAQEIFNLLMFNNIFKN